MFYLSDKQIKMLTDLLGEWRKPSDLLDRVESYVSGNQDGVTYSEFATAFKEFARVAMKFKPAPIGITETTEINQTKAVDRSYKFK